MDRQNKPHHIDWFLLICGIFLLICLTIGVFKLNAEAVFAPEDALPDPAPEVVPADPDEPVEVPSPVEPQYLEPEEFFARFGAGELVSSYAMSTNAPITAANCNGLKKILMQMFGDYVPIVTQFQYKNNNNSYYTYVHDITPDYIWWASAAVFFLCLWCVFRMGGAFLCRK